jgi:hypothetical protein
MTTVVFRRKLYTACVGIKYDGCESPRPYVTITEDKNILDENGEAVNFDKTGVNGESLRYDIIRALKLRYEIDNEDVIAKAGIYEAVPLSPDRIKCESVSYLTGTAGRTVRQWACENVYSEGDGRRKTYYWTRSDVERFLERPRPGKRARKKPPVL